MLFDVRRFIKKTGRKLAASIVHEIDLLLQAKLSPIHQSLENIRMDQQAATQAITNLNTTLDKIAAESAGLVASNQTLADALAAAQANGNTISPELEAAINASIAKAGAIDALVPDATTGDTGGTVAGGPTSTDPTV